MSREFGTEIRGSPKIVTVLDLSPELRLKLHLKLGSNRFSSGRSATRRKPSQGCSSTPKRSATFYIDQSDWQSGNISVEFRSPINHEYGSAFLRCTVSVGDLLR